MDVVVASVEKTLRVVASQKTKFVADKSISEASKSVYDLIVLPVSLTIVMNQYSLCNYFKLTKYYPTGLS